jgi:hypothetical protein
VRARWALVAAAAVAGAAVLVVSASGDAARDLGVPVGLADDPPFTVRLSGPLWRDRTVADGEGAPDVALLNGDRLLLASIAGSRGSRIGAVDLRVNGKVQQRVRPPCAGGTCPTRFGVSFRPRLNAAAGGNRRIEVVASDSPNASSTADPGTHVSTASIDVRVMPQLPKVVEVEPKRTPAGPPPGAALAARDRRAALQLVSAARQRGPLRALLGSTTLRVRAAGTLRDGRRALGATLFLDLAAPRSNVSATVPGYVPGLSRAGPYLEREVRVRVATLRDLLVDVDLSRKRIIAVEPGPASVTTFWSRNDRSATEGLAADVETVVDAAAGPTRLLKASDAGPAFLGYDGDLSLDPRRRDWPVSIVFAGRADVTKVKKALATVGFTKRGSTHELAYQLPGAGLRFDADRGVKTKCDAAATDVHVRLYAPAELDQFRDPEFGGMVAGTAHLDHADGCGTGTPRFGFSEEAERRIAAAATLLGWRVEPDKLPFGNDEPYRRDVDDPSHIWMGNGRATVIWVP